MLTRINLDFWLLTMATTTTTLKDRWINILRTKKIYVFRDRKIDRYIKKLEEVYVVHI